MREQRQQAMMLRTKRFALAVIRLYASLSRSTVDQVLGKQVLRSATSIEAHYREACRAKSNADFVSKIEGALQELDETVYWLELLRESDSAKTAAVEPLETEANELISTATKQGFGLSLIPHPSSLSGAPGHPSTFHVHPSEIERRSISFVLVSPPWKSPRACSALFRVSRS